MSPPRRQTLLALLAAAATLSLAGPGQAEPPAGGPLPPTFATSGGALFVSPAGEPFRGGGRETWFRQADTDHDGALSEAEMSADFLRVFRLIDVDGDGVIGQAEMAAYERSFPELRRGPPPPAAGAAPGGMGGPPPGGPFGGRAGREPPPRAARDGGGPLIRQAAPDGLAPYGFMNDPQPVLSADVDSSLTVSLAEFQARARRVFASLDMNSDGRLTPQELPERTGGR